MYHCSCFKHPHPLGDSQEQNTTHGKITLRNRQQSFPTLHMCALSPFCTYLSCLASISVSRTLHHVVSWRAAHYGALDLTEPIGHYSPFLLKDVFFGWCITLPKKFRVTHSTTEVSHFTKSHDCGSWQSCFFLSCIHQPVTALPAAMLFVPIAKNMCVCVRVGCCGLLNWLSAAQARWRKPQTSPHSRRTGQWSTFPMWTLIYLFMKRLHTWTAVFYLWCVFRSVYYPTYPLLPFPVAWYLPWTERSSLCLCCTKCFIEVVGTHSCEGISVSPLRWVFVIKVFFFWIAFSTGLLPGAPLCCIR